MPSDAERAWEALLRAHARLVPLFDREVQQATGLPLTWYDVLLELHSAGGRMMMGQLAERVVLSRTRVSRLVDELARAGLVAREANPADGRSAFAVITPEGVRRFRDAAPAYLGAIDREVGGPLSRQELRALATTLEKLVGRSAG
ncbi:MarR family winged helix-turn-helix transcriptional regulator [Agromyces binzhouensis]|uniref:MarR family transcriptional regulator n=1 Tax=Agromyces binzhouensis TaxID=1817495 RepID=A0A4Q2JT41_9MICO|nr:MarR family transcriptional regulator [Agromyces binzhouensis]RXZ50216.1 MarR family transcriptional regulator [Agromyces binzhouensis]